MTMPPADVERAAPLGPEGGNLGTVQSGWRLALREFVSNRLAVIGFAMLIFFVLFSFYLIIVKQENLNKCNRFVNFQRCS